MKRDDLSLVWTERFSQWGGGAAAAAAAGNELNLKIREVCTSAHIEGVLVHIGGFFSQNFEVNFLNWRKKYKGRKIKTGKMTVFSCIYLLFLFFWVLLVKVIIFFFCKRNKYWFFFCKIREGVRERRFNSEIGLVPLLCVLSNDCIQFAMNYFFKTKYLRLSSSSYLNFFFFFFFHLPWVWSNRHTSTPGVLELKRNVTEKKPKKKQTNSK